MGKLRDLVVRHSGGGKETGKLADLVARHSGKGRGKGEV